MNQEQMKALVICLRDPYVYAPDQEVIKEAADLIEQIAKADASMPTEGFDDHLVSREDVIAALLAKDAEISGVNAASDDGGAALVKFMFVTHPQELEKRDVEIERLKEENAALKADAARLRILLEKMVAAFVPDSSPVKSELQHGAACEARSALAAIKGEAA